MSFKREENVLKHLLHVKMCEERTLGIAKVNSQDKREKPKWEHPGGFY